MTRRIPSRFRRPGSWRFNMTPLIDVTFLLLTYFMLASHYASAEKPDIPLPRPDDSRAVDRPIEDKVFINVTPAAQAGEPELTFGPQRVPSMAELSDRLNTLAQRNPQVQVILRADRGLLYGDVRKVMEVIAAAGLSHLQVATELEQR